MELADTGGPAAIRSDHALSFDGVRATIEAIATELAQVWEKVSPSEATVEFGLNLTAKSGRLTGLVVEGGADASLKITLTWTHSERAPRGPSGTPGGSAGPDKTGHTDETAGSDESGAAPQPGGSPGPGSSDDPG